MTEAAVATALVSREVADGPPLFFPQPDVPIHFNFDQGNPASETYPLELLSRIAQGVLDDVGGVAFDYFDPATGYEELVFGYRGLRACLAERFSERDSREFNAESVILTSGSVQGISLVAHAYLDPGDAVFVEAASFPYAVRFMESTGAAVIPVRVGDDGMDLDHLEARIADAKRVGQRPKLIYTIPTFQLPTGTVMPLGNRRRLVELAEREQLIVHEDNVYGSLRYDGEEVPTLLSLDRSGLVMQSDSFSKTVAPGLRLGWVIGAAETVSALGSVRQDLGVSQFIARVMERFVAEDELDRHIEAVRRVYRSRRDAAVAAVKEHCADWVHFREPDGSFFLWLELDDAVDWDVAAERVKTEGVFCRPGERFAELGADRQYLRLAFSNVTEQTIWDGVAALGRALRDSQRTSMG